MILAATGHRPPKLGGYGDSVRLGLRTLAVRHFLDARPSQIISGMALGWDQAVAEAAIELCVPFIAAVPFEGQENRWPVESQRRYRQLIAAAAAAEIISPYPGARAMQQRNEWMVDRADRIVALWDGTWGGTFNCIEYANRVRVPVDNLWSRWKNDLSALLD